MPYNKYKPRGRQTGRRLGRGSAYGGAGLYARKGKWRKSYAKQRTSNAPQRANYSKWGGKAINRFAKVRRGIRSANTGVLKVAAPLQQKHDGSPAQKLYPHSNFITFYLSTPSLTLDADGAPSVGSNGVKGAIGFRDIIYSPTSLDAKHLAFMYLDFSGAHKYWGQSPIGNSLVVKNLTGTPKMYPALYSNLKGVGTAHPANATKVTPISTMITIDRIPESSQNPFPKVAVTSPSYEAPNHVISGIDIDLYLNSASVSDQWMTVKLCRNSSKSPVKPIITDADAKELVNKQTVTDARSWETVWQHSFFMPRLSTFQGSKNKTVHVSKKIDCNYMRSVVRKTSSAVGPTVHDGNVFDYGAMLSPHFTYDTEEHMYNNLALAITSRCVDDEYVAKDVYSTGLQTQGQLGTTASATGLEVATLVKLSNSTGFAKFGVTGTLTERFRCRSFTRQAYSAVNVSGPGPLPIHDHTVTNIDEGGSEFHPHDHTVASVWPPTPAATPL